MRFPEEDNAVNALNELFCSRETVVQYNEIVLSCYIFNIEDCME